MPDEDLSEVNVKKTILNGTMVPYVLERKSVKNINMRIKSDGVVYISANRSVPEKYILQLLERDKERIISVIEKIKQQNKNACDLSSTGYLGQKYPVEIIEGYSEQVDFDNKKIIVHIENKDNTEQIQFLILKWKSDRCAELYRKINNEVHEDFISHGYKVPLSVVTIKLMKSRWGSCNVRTGRISMNLRLIDYPLGCIYGVFYHEYMHYIHPDHSADFHRELNRIYPEYGTFDRILKNK